MDPGRDQTAFLEGYCRRIESLLPPLLSMQRSSWEQGVAAQALLECHMFNPTVVPQTISYVLGLVHDAMVRQGPDGRLAVLLNGDGRSDAGALDPACIGESFFYLLGFPEEHPSRLHRRNAARLRTSVERMLNYILKDCPRKIVELSHYTSTQPLLSHRIDGVQIWSDSIYMLSPFLASAAVYYSVNHDEAYIPAELARMACEQILLAAKVLQSSSGVWSHIYDLDAHDFKRKAFWGVGNGWVCAGIVRVLRTFAAAVDDGKNTAFHDILFEATMRRAVQDCYHVLFDTLSGCLRHIRPDGLFHDILDDTTSFVDTDLAQQLAYTIFRLFHLRSHLSGTTGNVLGLPALSEGVEKEWCTVAEQMYKAVLEKTDEWGFVRDVCGSPRFDSPGTAAEGQAWGILMEVARTEFLSSSEYCP